MLLDELPPAVDQLEAPTAEYDVRTPTLDAAVRLAIARADHADLLARLRSVAHEQHPILLSQRPPRLCMPRVVHADGRPVASQLHRYLAEESTVDAGLMVRTLARLRAAGLRAVATELIALRIGLRAHGAHDDYVQLTVLQVRDQCVGLHPGEPDPVPADTLRLRPPAYRLASAIHLHRFLSQADTLHAWQQAARACRPILVTTDQNGGTVLRAASAPPRASTLWPGRRFIDDWHRSSAGSTPLWAHWSFAFTDSVVGGQRQMALWPEAIGQPGGGPLPVDDTSLVRALQRAGSARGPAMLWYFLALSGDFDTAAIPRIRRLAPTAMLPTSIDTAIIDDWLAHPYRLSPSERLAKRTL